MINLKGLKMDKQEINLDERFNTFDNFLKANKQLLERGDKEFEAHKIFFGLSVEHSDDSPLSNAAHIYESGVDWEYFKATTRASKMYLSPVIKHIELGINNKITYSKILSNGKIIYFFEREKELLIYDYKTDEKIFLQDYYSQADENHFLNGYEIHPTTMTEVDDDMFITIAMPDWAKGHATVVIWIDNIAYHQDMINHQSSLEKALVDIVKLSEKIVMIFKDRICLIPISELRFLKKNIPMDKVNDTGLLTQKEIDAMLDMADDDNQDEMIVEVESELSSFDLLFKNAIAETMSNLLALNKISFNPDAKYHAQNIDFGDSPLMVISISVYGEMVGESKIVISPYLAMEFYDTMLGGMVQTTDINDSDYMDGVREIFLYICSHLSSKENNIKITLDDIELVKDGVNLEKSDQTIVYNLNTDKFTSKIFFAFDDNSATLFELSSEDIDDSIYSYSKSELYLNLHTDIYEIDTTPVYADLESIDSKITIEFLEQSPSKIYEFDNKNFIVSSTYEVNIYSCDAKLIKNIEHTTVVGLYKNNLYLLTGKELYIYDENLNIVDSYEVQQREKFKNPTIFQQYIITSENTITTDGILSMENKVIDTDINVWYRGEIIKIIDAHPLGSLSYSLGDYLVTYGLDGNNIWDKELQLVGRNKDMQKFSLLDDTLVISGTTLFDFELLKTINEEDKFFESENINNSRGVLLDDSKRVISYGFKTIYLWDSLSYNPIKQYDFDAQIISLEILDDCIVIGLLKEEGRKRVYIIFDFELNVLLNFVSDEYKNIYKLGEMRVFHRAYAYSIVDAKNETIFEKNYKQDVVFRSIDRDNYLCVYRDKSIFHVDYFNRNGELLKADYYQNDNVFKYPQVQKIEFYKRDSQEIFWYETSNYNDIGNIVVITIEENIFKFKLFTFDYKQRILPNDEWQSVTLLDKLKIVEDRYIFSNAEVEFFFDDEGESEGFNILQSREDIENSSFFKINEKQISQKYGVLSSEEERSLMIHEGVAVIAVVDDTIVINDSGRVKYLLKSIDENLNIEGKNSEK